MTMNPTTEVRELEARVQRLERALADLVEPRVVEATEVRLIDAHGKTKAVLSVDDNGPFLTFPDESGEIQTESLSVVTWERARSGPFERARAILWSTK